MFKAWVKSVLKMSIESQPSVRRPRRLGRQQQRRLRNRRHAVPHASHGVQGGKEAGTSRRANRPTLNLAQEMRTVCSFSGLEMIEEEMREAIQDRGKKTKACNFADAGTDHVHCRHFSLGPTQTHFLPEKVSNTPSSSSSLSATSGAGVTAPLPTRPTRRTRPPSTCRPPSSAQTT